MRWPNRHPHVLTGGMREAQRAMAGFLPLIHWNRFRRRNLNVETQATGFHVCACGDDHQALLWLIRRGHRDDHGTMRTDSARPAEVVLPGLGDGAYLISGWDTVAGEVTERIEGQAKDGLLRFITAPIVADRAFAIRRA